MPSMVASGSSGKLCSIAEVEGLRPAADQKAGLRERAPGRIDYPLVGVESVQAAAHAGHRIAFARARAPGIQDAEGGDHSKPQLRSPPACSAASPAHVR